MPRATLPSLRLRQRSIQRRLRASCRRVGAARGEALPWQCRRHVIISQGRSVIHAKKHGFMRSNRRLPRSGRRIALLCAAIAGMCVATYHGTLKTRDFMQDDQWIVADNPLLRGGWNTLLRLVGTGYWEAVRGDAATVQEYRPLLMLSFFLHRITTGLRAPPMHAANILLHAVVCILLFFILRRRMDTAAAAAAAMIFAVLPVHTEAVSSLTGRSELLSAVLILGSWMLLEADPGGAARSGTGKLWGGASLFLAALLTKEHAILLPALLAMSDWAFHSRHPLSRDRRKVHMLLLACAVGYLALRFLLLSRAIHAGESYFKGTTGIVTLLTASKFAVLHYLWPSLSGSGLCADYSRPLIPDCGLGDMAAWLCLAGLAALLAVSVHAFLRKRSSWAFWILAPGVFLLPTSHLLMPIDTLGAERFLYLPTMGLAAIMGQAYAAASTRARKTSMLLACALLCWYGQRTISRNQAWASDVDFYRAAVACNPVSAKAHTALGGSLIVNGRIGEGEYHLSKAIGLNPKLSHPHYNRARLAWERRDFKGAHEHLGRCLELNPGSPDAWVLMAVTLENLGRQEEAAAALAKALGLRPWDPLANYNIGRHHLMQDRPAEAVIHFERFLESAPDDPQARALAELVSQLKLDVSHAGVRH